MHLNFLEILISYSLAQSQAKVKATYRVADVEHHQQLQSLYSKYGMVYGSTTEFRHRVSGKIHIPIYSESLTWLSHQENICLKLNPVLCKSVLLTMSISSHSIKNFAPGTKFALCFCRENLPRMKTFLNRKAEG